MVNRLEKRHRRSIRQMIAVGVHFAPGNFYPGRFLVTPLRKRLFFRPLACLLLVTAGSHAYARDCGSAPEPYTASYSVNRNGDPDGAMSVTLERTGTDEYRYRMNIRVKWGILNAYIDEQSEFSFRNGIVLPDNFQLTQRVSFYKRREAARFDWDKLKATGEKKGDDFVLDIVPGMQDKLSLYLHLAASLCRGEYDVVTDVVSGPVLKSFDYRFQAKEPLDTVLGRLEAIHIRRGGPDDDEQTDMWLAAESRFLPVWMVYRDEDIITDMRLKDISFTEE